MEIGWTNITYLSLSLRCLNYMVAGLEPPSGNISICPVLQNAKQRTSYKVLNENDWNGVSGIWNDFTKYGGFPNDSISLTVSGNFMTMNLGLFRPRCYRTVPCLE